MNAVRILSYWLLFIVSFSLNGQSVGIGTTTPNPHALLDLKTLSGSPQGVLLPRTNTHHRAFTLESVLGSVDQGLILYDTDEEGIYWWNGTSQTWKKVAEELWTRGIGNKIRTLDSVGIGVANPAFDLEVKGTIKADTLMVTGGIDGLILISDNDGKLHWGAAPSSSLAESYLVGENVIDLSSDFGDVEFNSESGNSLLYLDRNGYLGVSTNSPEIHLDINGGIAVKPLEESFSTIDTKKSSHFRITTNSTGQVTLTDGITDGQWLFLESSTDDLFVLKNGGNVVIDGDLNFDFFDNITLIWNDSEGVWVETSRFDPAL